MRKNKNLMILGTSSGAGKSITAAGLCRIFYKDGYSVIPFKAQNMALNSFVTKEGLEIGRSQSVQAAACKIEPKGYMNPLLLKPCGNNQIQIILNGKPIGNMSGYDFSKEKPKFKKYILEAYKNTEKFDICVLEGAGSPVEINIKENDLVNMGMAEMADAPVILVADIDRGGVFASVVGTMVLLEPYERERVKGVIINKFRGRKDMLLSGIEKLEEIIKVPVLGVVPYFEIDIEDEDRVTEKLKKEKESIVNISVINLKHLSNFTDFDPLKKINGVSVSYADYPYEIENSDIIIIPGSKNTISDMEFLKEKGFDKKIKELSQRGKIIIGICGGFQILGKEIRDDKGAEGIPKTCEGLGLLNITTVFADEKTLTQYEGRLKNTSGILENLDGEEIYGYEIHQGVSFSETEISITEDKFLKAVVKDNVFGTYIHGIFENNSVTEKIINAVREKKGYSPEKLKETFEEYREKEFDKLEKIMRENLDIKKIYEIMFKK